MTTNSLPEERFLEEAFRILSEAEKRGIILRLLGSVAVKLHCPEFGRLYEAADRPLTDLDFMSYSRFNPVMRDFFTELGYTPNEGVIRYFGKYRHIYWHEEKSLQVDIFFDKLSFCHDIDFRQRLEIDRPTITVSDILLEKMQIVEINEKDLKDTVVLLREHEIANSSRETVDGKYVARLLADDWGFSYTFLTNLDKVRLYLEEFKPLADEDRRVVAGRIEKLVDLIEKEPKGLKWKLRAKVGTKKRWYREVEEVVR